MTGFPWISLLTLIPLLGAGILATWSPPNPHVARGVSVGISGLALGIALVLWWTFQPEAGFQYVEKYAWVPAMGV